MKIDMFGGHYEDNPSPSSGKARPFFSLPYDPQGSLRRYIPLGIIAVIAVGVMTYALIFGNFDTQFNWLQPGASAHCTATENSQQADSPMSIDPAKKC